MKSFIGTAAVFVALALMGCGTDEAATSAERQDPHFATVTGAEPGQRGEIRIDPPALPPPKKPLYRNVEVGSGAVAGQGDWITVNYLGVNYKTGKRQYGRWPPDSPLRLPLGLAGDGDAWERGIEGMKVGGRRELIIPSHLLYDTGTIDYVVDLLRVKSDPFATVTGGWGGDRPSIVPPDGPPPKKVMTRDLKEGSGRVAHRGDRVAVHYIGINYRTGEEQYPGRWPPQPPLKFRLGSDYVTPAWEKAIEGMKVGGRRELIIPSGLLFRTGTIDYVVDLVRVEPSEARN